MAKRKKRKLDQNEGRGKGVFLALCVGGAVLVVGVVLALFAFKKDSKPSPQQSQVSEENGSRAGGGNSSLVPDSTPTTPPAVTTNAKAKAKNPDLPAGKKIVWRIGAGKPDIRKLYTVQSVSMLTKAFGKEASLKTEREAGCLFL